MGEGRRRVCVSVYARVRGGSEGGCLTSDLRYPLILGYWMDWTEMMDDLGAIFQSNYFSRSQQRNEIKSSKLL